ncbi:MAG: class I SAM-dependent methyltransferase [Fibromonadales bacterium]|nr:class I SAM-dependent methyltransferase [Fibromonadales bacterium]
MTADFKRCIDLQIESNHSKNLFHKDSNESFRFLTSTIKAVQKAGEITPNDLNLLINYTTDKVLQEFCRVNQYFSFHENDITSLKTIYRDLYQDVIRGEKIIDAISRVHYENLKEWLEKTNLFSQKIYLKAGAVLESVACSEYSAALQSEILYLNGIQLTEPILDIGCGKAANLVKYLRRKDFEAYGIDRFSEDSFFIEKADWLAFDYGNEKWGTIVSNLGFSNHFVHNHLREDGDFIVYAKKYMEILQSLKVGGCFCYAPEVPFIEKLLDRNAFLINKHNIENLPFKTTIITKLASYGIAVHKPTPS